MSTVVLLGAGASHASVHRLPLMNGFFVEEHLRSAEYSNLAAFITERFGDLKDVANLNMEEVATHLHLAVREEVPFAERVAAEARLARLELDRYMLYRFHDEPRAKVPDSTMAPMACALHERLFKLLTNDDSVITLNYDLIAEYSLAATDGYPFAPASQATRLTRAGVLIGDIAPWGGEKPHIHSHIAQQGYFLKLHGSVDWFCCPSVGCPNHTYFYVAPPDEVMEDVPCMRCGAPLRRVFVPPVLGKALTDFPKIGAIWSFAYRKLRDADRWIVAGVSLTESDYNLRAMLREASANRKSGLDLHVINPNADHRDRIKRLARPTAIKEKNTFEDYLADVEKLPG